jgi:hypothetical protein
MMAHPSDKHMVGERGFEPPAPASRRYGMARFSAISSLYSAAPNTERRQNIGGTWASFTGPAPEHGIARWRAAL